MNTQKKLFVVIMENKECNKKKCKIKNLVSTKSKKCKIFIVIKIKKKKKKKKRFIPEDFNFIENFITNFETKYSSENKNIPKYKNEFFDNTNETDKNDKSISNDELFKNITNIETNQNRNQIN